MTCLGFLGFRPTGTLNQDQRLDAVSQCLQPRAGEPWARGAALLVLLFAQPIHKIIALTTDAFTTTNGELHLKLGTDSTPIPHPFATVFRELLENRPNTNADDLHQVHTDDAVVAWYDGWNPSPAKARERARELAAAWRQCPEGREMAAL